MNIYVGNLSTTVSEEQLQHAFETYGIVESVKIIKDRETGVSRGFGFVEMSTYEEAESAISGLNGSQFEGNELKVSKARSKFDRQRGPQQRRGGPSGPGGPRGPQQRRSGPRSGGYRSNY